MTLAHADTHAGSRSFRALAALDQEAMDALPQAIYLCADDGRMLRFNRKAAELWGRTPSLSDPGERFCGSVRLYRIDGALLPHDQCPMAAALQTGESFLDKEVVIEQPSGKRLTVLVNIVALKSKDGRISGAVNCFQDITDRKHWEDRSRTLIEDLLRTQQALRDSEQRLRDMIDALPAAIYTTDTEGRVTHFNPAAATLSGRTPDLGTDRWCVTWKLYRPDGSALQHEDCPMAVALKEGRAIRGEEIIAERPDGTRAWVTPYPTPLKDADGNIIGGINMLVDITARRAAEEHLRLMMDELNHRVKNTLAVVQAIARQTLRHEEVSEQAWTVFEGRLNAMGRAHTLLMQQNWDKADLKDIMREMARNDLRLAIDGPPVRLPARLAVNLSMALHELYTNATKYGALSAPGGRISISWDIVRDQRLVLQWIETGGPRVTKPSRSGFGTRMINLAIAGEAGGSAQIDFKDTGVACRIQAPLHLEQSDHMRGSGPG